MEPEKGIWYYRDAEQRRVGPFAWARLAVLLHDGVIGPETPVWGTGMAQ